MNLLHTLDQSARRLANIIALIGLTCLLLQATGIMIDVFLRFVFNSPLFGLDDINQLLLAVILASFFPLLLISGSNITIDFLGRALGTSAARWLDVFGQFITALLFVALTWQLIIYAQQVQQHTTLILRLPVAPSWWLATSLIALCIPAQLIVLAVRLRSAINVQPPASAIDQQV